MVEVKTAIKELLLKHSRVIIPGIGAFISEYKEAEVNKERNSFSPPGKELSFDTKIANEDDTLLSQYIATSSNISHEEALKKVHAFSEKVKRSLGKGEEVIFPHIGSLVPKAGGAIRFIAEKDENFLLDSFGFDSFTLEPKTPETNVAKKTPPVSVAPPKHTNRRKLLLPLLLVIATLLIISLAIFVPGIRSSLQNSWQAVTDKFMRAPDENNEKIVPSKDTTVLGNQLDEQTQARNALSLSEDSMTLKYANYSEFVIIAGSFSQYKNAEKLRQRLEQKGFEPTISLSDNNYYRVSLMTFTDRVEALNTLSQLQTKHTDLKLWILSI